MRAVSARVVVELLDKDAVIHESTVPFSWVLPFCNFLCYFHYFSISDLRCTAKELMYERGADIGLDQDVRFIEREHTYCARCVIAHSRQFDELTVKKRHAPFVSLDDNFCGVAQILCASVVSHPAPHSQHV